MSVKRALETLKSEKWLFILLLMGLAVAVFLIRHDFAWPHYNEDLLQLSMRHAFFRKSLLQFGQFPLRSPYIGGGYPILGDPEDPSLSPFVLLTLVFGETAGLKLIALLIFLAGAAGMFKFAEKECGYSRPAALFSALALAFSGWFHMRIVGGNINELYYFLTPLILLLYGGYRKTGRNLLPLSLLLFTIAMDGKLVFIVVMLFLFLYVSLSGAEKTPGGEWHFDLSVYKKFFVFVAAGILLSAVKILPVMELFSMKGGIFNAKVDTHPNLYPQTAMMGYTAKMLFKGLVLGLNERNVSPLGLNQLYVGPALLLAFLAAMAAEAGRLWRWGVLFTVFLFLSMGMYAPVDILKPLWHLPFYNMIGLPFKYFNFFVIFIICLGGGAFVDLLRGVLRSGARNYILAGFFCVALLPPLVFSAGMRRQFDGRPLSQLKYSAALKRSFSQVREALPSDDRRWTRMYFNQLQGVGTLNWYGAILLPENPQPAFIAEYLKLEPVLRPNPRYRGEVFTANSANLARITRFTPNRIGIHAELSGPDTVTVNQNYSRDFSSDKGRVFDSNGLLGVELPAAGSYDVELRYLPFSFLAGALISLLTAAALLYDAVAMRRRRSRRETLENVCPVIGMKSRI